MKTMQELEGDLIFVRIRSLDPPKFHQVKLVKYESGSGIWIESQHLAERMMEMFNRQSMAKTLVYFFPWSEVEVLFQITDVPNFSDKLLS